MMSGALRASFFAKSSPGAANRSPTDHAPLCTLRSIKPGSSGFAPPD
jgi:hypothetical protein